MERDNNGHHYAIHYAIPCSSVVAIGYTMVLEKYKLKDREDGINLMKIVDRYLSYHVDFLLQSLIKHADLLY